MNLVKTECKVCVLVMFCFEEIVFRFGSCAEQGKVRMSDKRNPRSPWSMPRSMMVPSYKNMRIKQLPTTTAYERMHGNTQNMYSKDMLMQLQSLACTKYIAFFTEKSPE